MDNQISLDYTFTENEKNLINSIITRVPRNEDEVKRFFFKLEDILGFSEVQVKVRYPDAIAFFKGIEINIEFELKSSNFISHKHDVTKCDMIVCWEIDEEKIDLPKLELSTINLNWHDLRKKAIRDYYILNLLEKRTPEVIEKLRSLAYKFNIDRYDAIANQMGITKKGLFETYIDKDLIPESEGGKLGCLMKDLDASYLEIELEGNIPVQYCDKCDNNSKCSSYAPENLGYYYVIITDEKRPRKFHIKKFLLPDTVIDKLVEPKIDFWNKTGSIRY